jgi:hypothetical protein
MQTRPQFLFVVRPAGQYLRINNARPWFARPKIARKIPPRAIKLALKNTARRRFAARASANNPAKEIDAAP